MTTLLIDGDGIAYRAACATESRMEMEDGSYVYSTDTEAAIDYMADYLDGIQKDFGRFAETVICISDPAANWRKRVLPTYKDNRADTHRPENLWDLKAHLLAQGKGYLKPTLEADDTIGILATHPNIIKGPKVIVSADKDFLTIPGQFYRVTSAGRSMIDVSPAEADRNHLVQALAGDATDGYTGCPGMGPVKAKAALQRGAVMVPVEKTFKRGPREGQTIIEWKEGPQGTPWEVLTSFYRRVGLTDADALQQARVARILRHADFDFITKRPIPWNPN